MDIGQSWVWKFEGYDILTLKQVIMPISLRTLEHRMKQEKVSDHALCTSWSTRFWKLQGINLTFSSLSQSDDIANI